MKLWMVWMVRKSGRGRCEHTLVEAESKAEAVKVAEAEEPGWVVYGEPKEEEMCA